MIKTADTPTPSATGAAPELQLRGQPRPVTRLSRKAIVTVAAAGVVVILGATFYALDPPRLTGERDQPERYNVANKPTAEGLEALPRSYRDLPPKLGAPLPGDLGAAVLDLEARAGITEPLPATAPLPFEPDPEADRRRAERLRQAKLAQEARESGVLFRTAQGGGVTSGTADAATASAGTPLVPGGETAVPPAGETRPASDRQGQARKLAFLTEPPSAAIYNPHGVQTPASPYQVMAGTLIAASLITGINSDLPGFVIAQVTENVYDTVTGRHLLIPQGARLLGHYDSVVAFQQARALVVWQRLLLPDGSSVVIDNLPATDLAGYAGLQDEVDFHTWRLIRGIALSTLLSVGTELATADEDDSDLVRAFRDSTQSNINRAGERIVERQLDQQPTITIRPGWPLRVIVHKDLVLSPYRAGGTAP